MITSVRLMVVAALVGCSQVFAIQDAKPSPVSEGFFPFYIAWNDSTLGTATDLSFMNQKPAGANGRIVVKDGHLAEEKTGKRVRFFGTNVAADEAFPKSKQDAEQFAAALAKRGINIVRLHHLENPWAVESGGSIWSPLQRDRQVPDPKQLDKLDYLIAQFIKNGIYVNLNLKVSKTLTEADGLDPAVKDVPFPFQKRLDYFEPRAVELQKDYAKRLLTHVNPYLGKSYVDEPGVAVVEVNNENCLLTLWPGQPFGNDLDKLPAPFLKQLADRWNDWLSRQVRNEAELVARWNKGVEPLGASVLPKDIRWTHEMQGEAKCEIEQKKVTGSETAEVKIRVDAQGGPDWHAQVHLLGLDLKEKGSYTLAFEARSPVARSTRVSATMDIEPWSNVGLDQAFATENKWTQFTMPFAASSPVANHTRVAFAVGGSSTELELRNVTVRRGSPRFELEKSSSLTSKSIPLPFKPTPNQRRDYVDFLVSIERGYADAMRSYLRESLGVKSLVYVSQAQWGGLAGISREMGSDVIDTHEYSEHPQFPADSDWDPKRWTIAQRSQIRTYATTGRFNLSGPAEYRVEGKPFSISEYDQAAPNDYAAETLPLLASIGAAQDWDAIYTFAQGPYGEAKNPNRIMGFFDHTNHPAKVALNPFAAVLFRTGAIEPISNVSTLAVSGDEYQRHAYADSAWRSADSARKATDVLATRFQIRPSETAGGDPTIKSEGPISSSLRFEKNDGGGVLVIDSAKAVGLIGFVGGTTQRAGAMEADVVAAGDNFAVLTAHAVDDKPIPMSSRVLLTAIIRAENPGMGWNDSRTSVGDQWGEGPVQCKGVEAAIRFRREKPCKVFALDTTGKRVREVPVSFEAGSLSFRISPEWKTVWYELTSE